MLHTLFLTKTTTTKNIQIKKSKSAINDISETTQVTLTLIVLFKSNNVDKLNFNKMKVEKNPKVSNDLCSMKVSDLNLNNKSKSKIKSKSSLNNAESSSLPKKL